MENEVWEYIPGMNNYYQASNLGRIKRIERSYPVFQKGIHFTGRMPEIIMSPKISISGYASIGFKINGVAKTYTVHRLVAMAFIPNPENKPCVDHINTVKSDNRVENLRWCTFLENSRNPITAKKLKSNGKAKKILNQSGINLIEPQSLRICKSYDNEEEASLDYAVNASSIFYRCSKKLLINGYYWIFTRHLVSFYSINSCLLPDPDGVIL